MNQIKILATIGPASWDKVSALDNAGVDIFRINLSHTTLENMDIQIDAIRRKTDKPICIDTEGAQSWIIEEGKWIHIGDDRLPCLTEKDVAGIGIAEDKGLNLFALSYTRDMMAVLVLRLNTMHLPGTVIAKIETKKGILNLEDILTVSDAILIDRGDLGKQIHPIHVPRFQKYIIRQAKKAKKPVYVATNLLESMVTNTRPTAGEMSDIWNTLCDGVDGLVLAAETAIGKYPVECVKMVRAMIGEHEKSHMIKICKP